MLIQIKDVYNNTGILRNSDQVKAKQLFFNRVRYSKFNLLNKKLSDEWGVVSYKL